MNVAERRQRDGDAAGRVLDVAAKIARDAPKKRGQYVSHALVYWNDINDLRDALDALGIDWRRA